MADIFISYARENQDTAKTLAQALADQGRSVWWDRNIRSGLVFDEVIEHELTIARCAIVLWSMASLGSRWVRDEASVAFKRNILLPVRIESVEPPLGFRSIQTTDLIGWVDDQVHSGFLRLIADITAILDEVAPKQQGDKSMSRNSGEAQHIGLSFVIEIWKKLERIRTDLEGLINGRIQVQQIAPNGEINPLTEVYEELRVIRIVIGKDLSMLLEHKANLAAIVASQWEHLRTNKSEFDKYMSEWADVSHKLSLKMKDTFNLPE